MPKIESVRKFDRKPCGIVVHYSSTQSKGGAEMNAVMNLNAEARPLEAETTFFNEHREDLLRQFPGKFVLVKGSEVLGGFQEIEEALAAGARRFGLESFLVRRTDEQMSPVSIPALALGILNANPYL